MLDISQLVMVKANHRVLGDISWMCAKPPMALELGTESPHADQAFNIWLNHIALKDLKKHHKFSVGSVIIKEKVGGREIGMLMKQAEGYDAAYENWAYAYDFHSPLLSDEIGKINRCIECHKKADDYVFAAWGGRGER